MERPWTGRVHGRLALRASTHSVTETTCQPVALLGPDRSAGKRPIPVRPQPSWTGSVTAVALPVTVRAVETVGVFANDGDRVPNLRAIEVYRRQGITGRVVRIAVLATFRRAPRGRFLERNLEAPALSPNAELVALREGRGRRTKWWRSTTNSRR